MKFRIGAIAAAGVNGYWEVNSSPGNVATVASGLALVAVASAARRRFNQR